MLYVSKGIPEKGGLTPQLRIVIGGQTFTLFGQEEELWLRGRLDLARTASEQEAQTVRSLFRSGLVESSAQDDPAARYSLLCRCILAPVKPSKRNALRRDEKIILDWLIGAGIRLSMPELVCLFDHHVRPTKDLLGEDNQQNLLKQIYPDEGEGAETLEERMLHAKTRDAVVDAVLGLLKKKRVVLL